MTASVTLIRENYPNHGKGWYLRDRLQLEKAYDNGQTLEEICQSVGRRPGNVVRKMLEMGLLRKESGGRLMRYDVETMSWVLWTIHSDDRKVRTALAAGTSLTFGKQQDAVRAAFELEFRIANAVANPDLLLTRCAENPENYAYSYTQEVWLLTRAVYRRLEEEASNATVPLSGI